MKVCMLYIESMEQLIKKRWILKSILNAILADFGKENGSKLAPKNDQQSKPPLKRKNQLNTSELLSV